MSIAGAWTSLQRRSASKWGGLWFQLKELARKHGILDLSSNYTLYAYMSNRMMSVLGTYSPFALSGLWDVWKGPQGDVTSCTIIVTEANQFMKPLHDRMPVILDPRDHERWLDPDNQDTAGLKALLSPAPEE